MNGAKWEQRISRDNSPKRGKEKNSITEIYLPVNIINCFRYAGKKFSPLPEPLVTFP
jgi:hypothetical protein